MKTVGLVLFSILSLALSTNAAISEGCRQAAAPFLIRGQITSPFGGDRLWSLDRISRSLTSSNADACLNEIRTNAVADAREYWQGYIAVKYSCNSSDSLNLPKIKPDTCPQDKWESIKANVNYIAKYDAGTKSLTEKKNPKTQKTAAQLERDLEQNAKASNEERCIKLGYNKEHLGNSEPSADDMGYFRSCLIGAGKGASSLIDTVKSSYAGFIKMIKDPEYRASVGSAIADISTLLVTSPIQTTKAIYNSMVNEFRQYKDDELSCLNGRGLAIELCNQIAGKGIATYLGVGSIRSIVAALKGGKAASTTALVLRDAAQDITPIKFLGRSGGGPVRQSLEGAASTTRRLPAPPPASLPAPANLPALPAPTAR